MNANDHPDSQGHPAAGASPEAVARTLARHPRPLGGDTARNVGPALVSLTDMVLNILIMQEFMKC